MSLKAKIEAVLFMTEKPLRAQAIAGIVGEDVQVVRQALLDLIHEYEERQGGLEIADEDGYSFQVKDSFSNLMDEFLPIEMSTAMLRTLSAIAIKQPIAQAEIIKVRGATAYDHIKELVARELVLKREDEKARSPMLSTTKKFQEYFRLTKDGKSLRQYLKRQMKKKEKEEQLSLFSPADGAGIEGDDSGLMDVASSSPMVAEANAPLQFEPSRASMNESTAPIASSESPTEVHHAAASDASVLTAVDTPVTQDTETPSVKAAEMPVSIAVQPPVTEAEATPPVLAAEAPAIVAAESKTETMSFAPEKAEEAVQPSTAAEVNFEAASN